MNIPAAEIRGVRFTRLGKRRYQQVVVEKTDPRGKNYFWIAGTPEWQEEEGTDHSASQQRTGLHHSATPGFDGLPGSEGYPALEQRLNGLVEGLPSE